MGTSELTGHWHHVWEYAQHMRSTFFTEALAAFEIDSMFFFWGAEDDNLSYKLRPSYESVKGMSYFIYLDLI